jgi:hypothetical protein
VASPEAIRPTFLGSGRPVCLAGLCRAYAVSVNLGLVEHLRGSYVSTIALRVPGRVVIGDRPEGLCNKLVVDRSARRILGAHAVSEEYRAAAPIDHEHDRADRASGRRLSGALLALWSANGPLDTWYAEEGGPIALWREWGDDVRWHALGAGHFFLEETPERTAGALSRFLGAKPP